jgi:signal transduction histidine kinase
VPLAPLVEECLRGLGHELRRLGAEVRLPQRWPTPLGFAPWVERVLANYLSNALKYGGRPPRIELGAEALGSARVRVWVRDDGRGIPPAERERLFVPFTRLFREDADGHGLGLSIVRRLVERMGGEVGVESAGRPGEGSTFHFTLPAAGP